MISKSVISNRCQRLFKFIETIQLDLNKNHCNDFDHIPLPLLYSEVLSGTSLNNSEIKIWGEGS